MAQAFRSHTCGELRPEHVGQRVTLAGWVHRRRDHGHLAFFDLRDRYGLTQVVTNQEDAPDAHAAAEPARSEWVVQVEGVVRERPEGTANAELATGAVEVAVDRFTVLNPSKVPPFYINEEQPGLDESLRLEYRYLDLRRPSVQSRMLMRSRLAGAIRRALEDDGFVEIETPNLIRSHAGGRPRLRGSVAAASGRVLCAAPEPAGAEAAADGRRLRPLLPAGPRLPRRGPARGPAAGAHPGRHRDELRLRGRRARDDRAHGHPGGQRGPSGASALAGALPPSRVPRGHGAIRIGQARYPLRHGARRPVRCCPWGRFPRVRRAACRWRSRARHRGAWLRRVCHAESWTI